MVTRWQGGLAAVVVTLVAAGLVILDLTDGGLRRWWDGHAVITDTVAGLLVLLITVLVVDQVVRLRQVNDRSRAVAAQAAIIMGQARRSSQAVSAALDGPGDRDAARDEVRTYMIMLLVGAPVLIDARASRVFLEEAQRLGGEMARTLAATAPGAASTWSSRLGDGVARLGARLAPLLQALNSEERVVAGESEGDGDSVPP
jgi:hypothetical protein